MSSFRNLATGVVVSVSSEKDGRFGDGWVSASAHEKDTKRPAKASAK